MQHTPVLKEQIVQLFTSTDGIIVDVTIGSGGHSAAILAAKSKVKSQKSKPIPKSKIENLKSQLIGLDQDYDALTVASSNLKSQISKTGLDYDNNITLVHGNFRDIKAILKELKIDKVNGILADLGMSSMQLDDPERGFSFKHEAPLDMRMNYISNLKSQISPMESAYSGLIRSHRTKPQLKIQNLLRTKNYELRTSQLTAELIVKTWNETKIADLLWNYGEERFARKIARAIRENRKNINTTKDLADLCEKCIPPRFRKYKIHPATKTFQALRIAVNDEINALKDFLRDAPELLVKGGRLAIISFHSLEDRLVKHRFSELTTMTQEPSATSYELLTKHPITPTDEQTAQNPRSRSAKLRAIQKVASSQ